MGWTNKYIVIYASLFRPYLKTKNQNDLPKAAPPYYNTNNLFTLVRTVLGLVNGSVFVLVRLCSLVLGVLTFYYGLAGVAPLAVRAAALAMLVTSQVPAARTRSL